MDKSQKTLAFVCVSNMEGKMDVSKKFFLAWCFFFAYSLAIGFIIQKVILPYFFPSAHWGHGLMIGGDWISFYQNANSVAQEIQRQGWSAWSLRPPVDGQVMTGITALFFALTGIYEPWVMLPYNAFLHASAGLVLILILKEFGFSFKISFISSLPLIFFPSSLYWVSQIHRDGLYILGFLLYFYALVLLMNKNLKKLVFSIPIGMIGIFLICLARGHMSIPLKYLNLTFFVLLTFFAVYKIVKMKKIYLLSYVNRPLIFFFFFVIVHLFAQTQEVMLQQEKMQEARQQKQISIMWSKEWWVPEKVDKLLYQLAYTRYRIIKHVIKESAGAIDIDFIPKSVSDFIAYTPRALILGFFSPFPDVWFTKGGTPGGTLARYITPFETFITWIGLLLFFLFLWKFSKDVRVYLIFFTCILFVWLHVLSEPNLGPIYRKRYVFVHTLVALSFANFLSLRENRVGKV